MKIYLDHILYELNRAFCISSIPTSVQPTQLFSCRSTNEYSYTVPYIVVPLCLLIGYYCWFTSLIPSRPIWVPLWWVPTDSYHHHSTGTPFRETPRHSRLPTLSITETPVLRNWCWPFRATLGRLSPPHTCTWSVSTSHCPFHPVVRVWSAPKIFPVGLDWSVGPPARSPSPPAVWYVSDSFDTIADYNELTVETFPTKRCTIYMICRKVNIRWC